MVLPSRWLKRMPVGLDKATNFRFWRKTAVEALSGNGP